jgi:hypothetical protein
MRQYETSKIVLLLLMFPWAVPAHADKWLPPKPETYESRRGTYRLTVFPAQPETHIADSPGAAPIRHHAMQLRCEAVLERMAEDRRRYEQVWRKPLINTVAPVSALVSEADGSFVTFDNWGKMGWGDDVIVLYSGSGDLKKKFALTNLMTEADFKRFPRTASSVHWNGQHELDNNERTLSVRIVAVEGVSAGERLEGYVTQEGEFRTIRIDMSTGDVLTADTR